MWIGDMDRGGGGSRCTAAGSSGPAGLRVLGGGKAEPLVDDVAEPPRRVTAEIVAEKVGQCIKSAGRLAGDVRGDDQPRGVPEPAFRRGRLPWGDVHRGGVEVATLQRVDQRVLVDQRSAGDVHEDRAPLHAGDRRGIDHPPRRGGERHAEEEDVGLFEQRAE